MKKRLLKKQGFTMVELIVVVAIIGIMLGIVVPLMSTNSARERESRENARAFYSNVQELMIDEKLHKTALGGDYTIIYAEVTPQPGVSTVPSVKVYKINATQIVDFNTMTVGTADEITSGDLKEFSDSLKKLLSANDQDVPVCYYAIVDNKYRVVRSYFSLNAKYDDIKGKTFVGDCRVASASGDQVWTGSYPYTESVSGKTVFA